MAATAKNQLGQNSIDTMPSLYSRTFDNIVARTNKVPREMARFFRMEDTNLATYKEGEVFDTTDTPPENRDSDRIPLMTGLEGYNKTITNVRRRSGMIITREAVEEQKTRKIAQTMTGLPKSAARLEELLMATIFNGGFDSETTGDGSYVFATDHYYEDPKFGQWSNVAAAGGTFTTTSYLAAWLNMQNRKDPKGMTDFKIPASVMYSPAIHEAVMKVHGSTLYPQNSLNAKLPELFGAFEPILNHYKTDTASWFVNAKEDDNDKGFVFVWQTRPEYKAISDSMNPDLVLGRRLRMSCGVGAVHGRSWYGDEGN